MVEIARIAKPCQECAIHEAGAKCATKSTGPRTAKILVVCPPPTGTKNLSDKSMRTFAAAMRRQGFDREDFVFVNGIRCPFNPEHWLAKDRNRIIKPCREYLLRVIERMQPEVIIGLGALAGRQIENRAVKIMKARGVPKWHEDHNAWVMHMLDPTFVNLYPQHVPTFNVDCKTIRNFIDSSYDLEAVNQSEGHYRLVDDLQFLIDERPAHLAFDVETQGLRSKARDTRLLSMQFSTAPGTAYMVTWDKTGAKAGKRQRQKLRRQVRQLMCHPGTSVIGQNLKYDANWLLEELGIRFRLDHDTLMLNTLLDENSNDKGIDHQIKIHVPEMAGYNDAFNQKYDKSDMDAVPMDDFVQYGCGDADAALRLYHVLRPKVEKDPALWAHYRHVTMPGLNAFVGVENRGMHIDRPSLDEFAITLANQVAEQKQSLLDRIPRGVKRKHAQAGIKFSRQAFLKDILFTDMGLGLEPRVWTKTTEKLADEHKQPSTSSKDHLPYFFDDPRPVSSCMPESQRRQFRATQENADTTVGDFVMDLAEYVKNERLLSTNVVGFRDKYMVGDYIYPSYSLWTAVTGRSASQDPNGQNFPKRGKAAKAYRRIFIPPPGMIQLEADLSQAELRIAGDMAGDQEMIRIYQEDGDIHTETALIVMGITMQQFRRLPRDEQGLARFKAKAVNFGFLYGMGWRKFIVYAKTQYGVEFTEQEARRIRDAFFLKYRGLGPWHRSIRDFVSEHKFVRSYSGRIRHLPMVDSTEEYVTHGAERQGINSPVQEFASSLGVMAMGRLDLEVDDRYLALTGFVHDALYAYCAPEHVEWGARTLKHYMETNDIVGAFGRVMDIPITADVSFGWNGRDMYEMGHIPADSPYDFDALAVEYGTDDGPADFGLPPQLEPSDGGLREVPNYLRLAA
jgi:uracil-DNA glycosylase family 4